VGVQAICPATPYLCAFSENISNLDLNSRKRWKAEAGSAFSFYLLLGLCPSSVFLVGKETLKLASPTLMHIHAHFFVGLFVYSCNLFNKTLNISSLDHNQDM